MSRRGRPLLHVVLLCLLVAASGVRPGVATAVQPDDASSEPGDTLPTTEVAAPEPPPLPTEVPVDIPTDIPAAPTATLPPPEPTATTVPPTATTTPSPTPTSTPSPHATATATATIPATMTPTPTPPSRFAPQSIVSGSGCTQTSASDIVETTGFVSFSCDASSTAIFTYYSGSVSAPTAGWQYRINGGSWLGAGSSLPATGNFLYRSVPAFTLDLRPTTSVAAGSSGTVTVSVSCTTGCSTPTGYTTTLGATRQPATPTAADLQLACTPTTVTATNGQPHTVQCVYSGLSSLGTRTVTLSQVTVQAPAGWAIASSAGTITGTTLTIRANATIRYHATAPATYAFAYTLTPSCTASTIPQPVQLTSTFAFGATPNIAGAASSLSIARSSASSLTLAVTSSSLAWTTTVSFTATTVSGNLTYRIVASGCSGWSVSVSAGPYVSSGANGGRSIPAANLRLTNAGSPTVIAGSATGVSSTAASGSMATSQKVLTASSGNGTGTYEQRLDLSLTIPGNTRAGTYTSTITLTSAAAP